MSELLLSSIGSSQVEGAESIFVGRSEKRSERLQLREPEAGAGRGRRSFGHCAGTEKYIPPVTAVLNYIHTIKCVHRETSWRTTTT